MAAIPSRTPVNNLAHPSMTHKAATPLPPYLTASSIHADLPHLYLHALESVVLVLRYLDLRLSGFACALVFS